MKKRMLQRSTSKAFQILMTAPWVFLAFSPSVEVYKKAQADNPPVVLIGRQPENMAHETWVAQKRRPAPDRDERSYDRLAPEEQDRLKGRSRRWEGLSPEKRQELERRMERWRQLPPEEQELIRKRHQQWQELPPEEQERIREKLNRWDTLSPQDREEIRRKFRRP
jgi:hypothetical protein